MAVGQVIFRSAIEVDFDIIVFEAFTDIDKYFHGQFLLCLS